MLWLLWEIDREREAWVKVAEVDALVISGEKKHKLGPCCWEGCFGRPSLSSGAKFHLVIFFLFSHAVTKEKAIYLFLSLLSSLSITFFFLFLLIFLYSLICQIQF